MTNEKKETILKLNAFFELTSEEKAQELDKITTQKQKAHIFNQMAHLELCKDYDIFYKCTLFLKSHIERIISYANERQILSEITILMTIKIDNELKEFGEEVIKVIKDRCMEINNIGAKLEELILNPEETFKDKNKILETIKLNSDLIDNCKQFRDYTQEALKKGEGYITDYKNLLKMMKEGKQEAH